MSKSNSKKVSEFSIEGRFLGFESEDGDTKYLMLATSEGECGIKLCKKLRASSDFHLTSGDWVQVMGEKKLNPKTGKLKLKAERVIPPATHPLAETSLPPKAKSAKTKASILVCQKSSCMKRGGKAVCQALETALGDRGLADQVAIKGTGCLKQCSSGPNLVVMPNKTRYSRIKPAQIPAMLEKHFTSN